MTRTLIWLFLALLFSPVLAQQPPATKSDAVPSPPATKYPLEAWKPVVTKEGNFSVLSPLALKGETVRFQLQDGSAVESRFTIRTTDGQYQAAITFLSENLATPQVIQERFEKLLKGLKQNSKVVWLSGGAITLDGNPGIEFKARLSDNQLITWSRQYFAFGCVYELTARYLPYEPELKEPQMFLDSFKILGPPLQRPVLPAMRQEAIPDFTPLAQNLYYVLPETLRANAVEKPEPKFDTEGKAYTGAITLLVTVSTEGKVIGAEVADGFPGFYEPALKALKKWRFTPFRVNGRTINVQGRLTFKLGGTGSTTPQ